MSKSKFTLIELLVVVAIIGILASMLLPSLARARERAHTAVCKSNQKQILTAIQMYANTDDEVIPIAGYTWANILGSEHYLSAPKVPAFDNSNVNVDVQTSGNVFFCPSGMSDQLSKHAISGQWNGITFEETQRPWRSGNSDSRFSQYEAGYDVWYGVVGRASRAGGTWSHPTWRDSLSDDGWPKLNQIENTVSAAAFHAGTHHMHTHAGDQSRISARHNGAKFTNVAFYDGHVMTYTREKVVGGISQTGDSDYPVVFQSSKN